MFVKPGHRQDDPALPLIVRGANRRLLSPQGENVPEITFWYRRLRDGDVVLAEPPAPPPPAPRPAVTATVIPPVVDQAAARAAADAFVFPPPAPAGEAHPPAAAEHDAAAPLPVHAEPLAETKP
jgi:Protein of unknown function (DUF2635)